MNNMLILGAAGFTGSFLLLFFFAAKYRAASLPEDELDLCPTAGPTPAADGRAPQVSVKRALVGADAGQNPAEVLELKEKVKQLHYRIEELKLVHETKSADAAKTMARLESRLETFESEYVNKLQPALAQIIEELERLKPSETTLPPGPELSE